MLILASLFVFAAVVQSIGANTPGQPFEKFKRQSSRTSNTQVDLGYAIYEGVANSTTNLNVFKGIRYAAPPIGALRWQAPHIPKVNRSAVTSAASFASSCPQAWSLGFGAVTPGASIDEDCLFLNVYAPQNAQNLPVLVWIHGGGYAIGDGTQDMSDLINANNNSFIGVAIQYRLGAFGFLAGDEVYRNGVVNSGILDQVLALKWVQAYIKLFGGDPNRVTIAGLSAGAGSVMLLDIAYGGTLGTSLFVNSISASPYLPQQWSYKDVVPSQSYYAFATAAGCPPQAGHSSQSTFECLISQSTETLQNASVLISLSGASGTLAFLPVTDGIVLRSTPSQALRDGKVNGLNQLSSNVAQEADFFVPRNITTESDLVAWLQLGFPLLTEDNIKEILRHYPSSNDSASLPMFATAGDAGPTFLDVSQTATGQQQRVQAIYGETTFMCPSYWLAEAYNTKGRSGYKYQYSVPYAHHGSDQLVYFGQNGPNVGPDAVSAIQRMWGNFITSGNPSISSAIANGPGSNTTSPSGLEDWPVFTENDRRMANLNQTGGSLVTSVFPVLGLPVSVYVGPGQVNDFEIVNANAWEGGRGTRCDFWRSIASNVPQ